MHSANEVRYECSVDQGQTTEIALISTEILLRVHDFARSIQANHRSCASGVDLAICFLLDIHASNRSPPTESALVLPLV